MARVGAWVDLFLAAQGKLSPKYLDPARVFRRQELVVNLYHCRGVRFWDAQANRWQWTDVCNHKRERAALKEYLLRAACSLGGIPLPGGGFLAPASQVWQLFRLQPLAGPPGEVYGPGLPVSTGLGILGKPARHRQEVHSGTTGPCLVVRPGFGYRAVPAGMRPP